MDSAVSTFITKYKELRNPTCRLNEKLDRIHEEIHAGWLFTLYDYLSGAEGRKCILKGWEKAGVAEIDNSDKPLPPVDPFEEIYRA